MSTKKYTSIANIKDEWLTNIAPNYLEFDNVNNYQSGIFGYVNEIMANTTEDTFNAVNIARREFYPTTAQNKQSLYKMATLQRIGLPMTTPGSTKAVFLIPVKDVIEASSYNDGIYTCYIDNSLAILADDIPFIIDYPIIIISKKSGSSWIHTSHYDISILNSLDNSSSKYIMNKTIIENGVEYLLLSVILRQASVQNITQVITKDNTLDTSTLDFTFDGDLANFEVFYTQVSGGTEIQLKKILYGSATPSTPFCSYQIINDNTIRLYFVANSYFTPEFNSEIRVAVYTSLGNSGNFESFKGSLTCIPNSITHPENNTMLITGLINGACTGGLDKATTDEFRQKIINAYSTNNTITTSNDLQVYFDNLSASVSANAKNNRIMFRKKRDDALIRLFGAYCMIKDSSNNVVPTNTLDIKFKRSWLSSDLGANRLFIKPGTLFEYGPNSSSVNYTAVPVDSSELSLMNDLDVYDNNSAILYKFIYADNQFVAIGSNGSILSSTNGTTWTKRVSNISNHLRGIAYGNGKYVVVGAGGTILTSTNGVLWTAATSNVDTYLYDVAYNDGYFIAVGESATMLSSTDGTTWTQIIIRNQLPTIAAKVLRSIAYGGTSSKYWHAVGDDGVIIGFKVTSTPADINVATNWKLFGSESHGDTLNKIIYADSKFICVGSDGALISKNPDDTLVWTNATGFTSYILNDIAYVNNLYIVCGYNGLIMTSTDLITWVNRTSGSLNNLNAIGSANSIFIAIGDSGTILNSSDGLIWGPKPLRFLFTNPFLIAVNINPNIIGHYLNSIDSSRSISYTYVNDNTLTQFIASGMKIKRNALIGENFYKFSLFLTPASDLDATTIVSVNDPALPANQIRATKNGMVSKIYFKNKNVVALITYNDGTTTEIAVSSYINYADNAFTYSTGYTLNFNAGESFVANDILAVKKVTDLGKLRAVGNFKDVLYDNNMYIPFCIEDYNAENNYYEIDAYLSTDDVMTLDAKLLVTHGIFRTDASENDNVTIPMNKLDLDVHIFYNNDDINYTHKYSSFEYVKNYTLTNTYTNAEANDLDKISLIQQIDFIRNVMTFDTSLSETDYTINITEIPMAQASWCKIESNFNYLISTMYQNYLNLYETYFLLENNFGIDLKFYNTYGKSRFFKVGIKDDVEILDNINCSFSLGVYLTSLSSTEIFITKFKEFIKEYIESANYINNNGQSIYILNMISEAKAEFPEIGYIEYYGFNSYNYKYQKIEGVSDSQISSAALRKYIPEFLNIRSIYNGTSYTPKINVVLLES